MCTAAKTKSKTRDIIDNCQCFNTCEQYTLSYLTIIEVIFFKVNDRTLTRLDFIRFWSTLFECVIHLVENMKSWIL